ncbi:MAG: membrane protein insertion efficiency factor YidD [Candidatus Muiribacteriota bacterium]
MNTLVAKICIVLINLYKKIISPYLGNQCRFYPSCSSYSIEAFRKYGFLKGSVKAIFRIIRCNKFFKGGYDPVL